MLVLKKKNIYFAIELGLREISFAVYVHAPICTERANDAKDVQCNTEESPLKLVFEHSVASRENETNSVSRTSALP